MECESESFSINCSDLINDYRKNNFAFQSVFRLDILLDSCGFRSDDVSDGESYNLGFSGKNRIFMTTKITNLILFVLTNLDKKKENKWLLN